MKRKCDECGKPATVHEVEIIKGQKIEKHLCDDCARSEGIPVKDSFTPINELLTNFVKMHSGSAPQKDLVCENCGLTFSHFREHSLLGCPECYTAFDKPLGSLLERAHEGGTQHLGKTAGSSGSSEMRQQQLLHMRSRLAAAVSAEDYELAARLRDDINNYESHS